MAASPGSEAAVGCCVHGQPTLELEPCTKLYLPRRVGIVAVRVLSGTKHGVIGQGGTGNRIRSRILLRDVGLVCNIESLCA